MSKHHGAVEPLAEATAEPHLAIEAGPFMPQAGRGGLAPAPGPRRQNRRPRLRQAARLATRTATLAAEHARQSKDWETELRWRAKEIGLMKELGLTVANPAVAHSGAPSPSAPNS